MKYFKVKTSYDKIVKEETKKVSEYRIFNAINYQEAEEKAIEYIKKYIAGQCDCDISKVSYEEIIPISDKEKPEEIYWYEVRATFIITDDEGNDKYNNQKYLVEAEDLEDSLDKLRNYFKSKSYSEDEWFFSKVEETNIKEVII